MANTNARDMKRFKKTDFPVSDVRRFLEPGPIVLVSSGIVVLGRALGG